MPWLRTNKIVILITFRGAACNGACVRVKLQPSTEVWRGLNADFQQKGVEEFKQLKEASCRRASHLTFCSEASTVPISGP